ncbi:MAG: GMC family oxidoreductase [Halobacteriota archaeon]
MTDRRPVADADVCVVGSGPAGALVADALAGRGRRVVVLDAGEHYTQEDRFRRAETWMRPDMAENEFWLDPERDTFSSSGEVYARLNDVRVKGVGGSSLLWNGNTPRLRPKDFNMRSRYGLGTDWPIDYADLRPYYAAAERELGVSGDDDNPHGAPREEAYPMPAFPRSHSDRLFADACDALAVSMASQPKAIASEPYQGRAECDGFGVCNACPIGARYTAEQHVERARRQDATVIDRAQVLELVHDDAGDRVTGAVYATPNGETHRQEATAFVLAAGGVETPRLLLLSDSEAYPDGLANSSGVVGRYLMDHCEIEVRAEYDGDTRQNEIGFVTTRSDEYYTPAAGADAPRSFAMVFHNRAGPGLSGLINTPTAVSRAFGVAGDPGVETLAEAVTDPFNSAAFGEDLVADLDPDATHGLGIRAVGEVLPRERNAVALDRSTTDDHGRPVPDVSLTYGDYERETLARAEEVIRDIMDEVGAEVTGVVGYDDAEMGSHHIGTTRMGTDPEESVVDPTCRTHDLDNLWIASSSVFPTSGAVNPTLSIAALSLQVADHVDTTLLD